MTDQPPPTELQKQHWKEAERAFDERIRFRQFHSESLDRYALLTIRSVQLSAAGGIVAVLGFYGTHYDAFSKIPGRSDDVGHVLLWLFGSLVATMFAAAGGYFSQTAFAAAVDKWKTSYQAPHVSSTPEADRLKRVGDGFRIAAICLMVVAACSLMCGAWSAYELLG